MANPRKVEWIASSLKDLTAMPDAVKQDIGYALHLAQNGEKSPAAKTLKGIGPGTLEIVEDHDGGTYRAVYTVRFAEAIYVLHVFQKRSKKGIETPKHDIDLV